MTDRELLKLAAKASGVALVFDPEGISRNCTVSHPAMNIYAFPLWNPLKDNGDALRLAVKLKLTISHHGAAHVCESESGAYFSDEVDTEGNGLAATRRAIVRVAAEIGRAI